MLRTSGAIASFVFTVDAPSVLLKCCLVALMGYNDNFPFQGLFETFGAHLGQCLGQTFTPSKTLVLKGWGYGPVTNVLAPHAEGLELIPNTHVNAK